MEPLALLTRRQVDALRAIALRETPARGVSLGAIADDLEVTPPSALGHLTLLEEQSLVVRHRGKTRLTPKGRATLEEYQRHHRVAEALFGNLGLAPEVTCQAAREIDLALSHRTVEVLCRAQNHPSRCPHGEPIEPCRHPGKGA